MESILKEIRYSLRMLLKKPGFTAVAVLTLALGIGANTAIFTLVHTVLLRPLPFPEPEQLIGIRESKVGEGNSNPLAWRSFFEFRDKTQTLDSVAAYLNWNPDIELADSTIRVQGATVTHGFFHVLGAGPLLGRDFTPEDDKPSAPPVVVLSYELWQGQYDGDQQIIGKTLRIDGVSYAIIGVMPPVGLDGQGVGGQVGWRSIWTLFQADEATQQNNPGRLLRVNARLKSGVTLSQTRTELATLMEGLKQTWPATHSPEHGVYAAPLKDYVVNPDAQKALWIMFGAVVCVLLIACANVANLLLARATEREKEIAVRAALGASRRQIVQQLLCESILLSACGAAVGIVLAHWLLVAAGKFLPAVWQRMGGMRLDVGMFAFTLSLTVVTGFLFGLLPALNATKIDLNDMLKDGRRNVSGNRRQQRWRGALVVTEIALALVLLIGSGLLLRSFARLRGVELGFNPDKVLTMSLRLPNSHYSEAAQRARFFRQTLDQVRQLPGVESAAICFSLLMTGDGATDPVVIEGHPPVPKGEESVIRGGSVSADYFKTLGIALRQGRAFTEQEVWQGAPVIIVNEALARHFFPNEDPIGKRLKAGYGDPPFSTIVGVVANHIQPGVDNRIWEEMFYPYVNTADPPLRQMNLVVKTTGEPATMTDRVINEVRKLDRLLPIAKIRTMHELTEVALQADRFTLWLLGAFATLALLLGVSGIYSVMTFTTAQRTHEIGIRMALGAESNDVLKLVLKQGLSLAMIGTVVGIFSAFVLTRLMENLLFEVSLTDPLTYTAVVLLLLIIALLACWLPARRATKVDPMVALRCD